jgi:hypothetical protein
MALLSKPMRIGQATYLRVPKDCEDLLAVMAARTCTVDFQISEKGCSLVYTFARPVPDLVEEAPSRPLWMIERQLLAQ